MRQFHAAKSKHPDALLFFRMGDFYELFLDDAKVAAKVLGLTLTARDKQKTIPMAGVPVKAMEGYLSRLVRAGYSVAICEQLQDPKEVKGIVDRGVVRVVSPGTLVDEQNLTDDEPLFVLAISVTADAVLGLAWADLSTGAFRCTQTTPAQLTEELGRIAPAEIVFPDIHESDATTAQAEALAMIRDQCGRLGIPFSLRPSWDFDPRNGGRDLCEQLGAKTLEAFGVDEKPAALAACGAVLEFLRDHQKNALDQIRDLKVHDPSSHLVLDEVTRRTLEITKSQKDGGREGSLLEVLDRTETPMGARKLREWLLEPLVELADVESRLDAVGEMQREAVLRRTLRDQLEGMGDLERSTAKLASGRAGARDLIGLGQSLERIPELKQGLSQATCASLCSLNDGLDVHEALAKRISNTLIQDPPLAVKEGGLIRDGFNAEVDELRALSRGGKEFLVQLQQRESERTGIALKIGFNRVFGYYFEVPNSQRGNLPEEFIRKQTLKNAERYITPELKEYEEKVLSAEEKVQALEYKLFLELRDEAAQEVTALLASAQAIAELDVFLSLAQIAADRGFVRPELLADQKGGDACVLEIENGRHPVVEASMLGDPFVPNDTTLNGDTHLVVLTGPNMSGKSTWLRQTALIVLMAQMGSFVPATRAKISIVDQIYTRLGTGDDIARGQSTFMVEMVEIANILRNATQRSLLLLDEVGRGTSTFDGLAIAWAVCEHAHDRIGARCLFATHYHQLTDLASELPAARNLNVAVREHGDDIVFLHRIEEGGTDRSYGIHVARLAGVPAEVLDRSREVLQRLERGEEGMSRRIFADHLAHTTAENSSSQDLNEASSEPPPTVVQHSIFDLLTDASDELLDELRTLDLNELAPIEAWKILARVKDAVHAPEDRP